jgi:hypothetical protein
MSTAAAAIPPPSKHSVAIETLGAKKSETKEGLRKINNYLLKKKLDTAPLELFISVSIPPPMKSFSSRSLRE